MRYYFGLTVMSVMIIGTVMIIYMSVFEKISVKNPHPNENSDIAVSITENSDIRLAALCADALCRDGEYLLKVAVCGVIFNRVNLPGYPDTVAEIVFTDPIFSKIYDNPLDCVPSEESYNAVIDAMNGLSPCPSARGFYDEENCENDVLKENVMIRLGEYTFY